MWRNIYFILIFSFISLQCKKESDINTNTNSNNSQNSFNHNLSPGNSGKDFLRSTIYKSLKIEIQYMPGCKPESGAIDILVNFLNERLNKPSGIFVQQREIDPSLKTTFSLSDISGIETQNRIVYTSGDQLTAYVLIVDGSYSNSNALALSYKNTSICLFGEPIKYFSIGISEDAKAKTLAMLIEHEFGHLLGLVDLGTFMVIDHMDATYSNHCENNDCIMHHTFESPNRIFSRSFVEIPPFDTNCISDLKANGGK